MQVLALSTTGTAAARVGCALGSAFQFRCSALFYCGTADLARPASYPKPIRQRFLPDLIARSHPSLSAPRALVPRPESSHSPPSPLLPLLLPTQSFEPTFQGQKTHVWFAVHTASGEQVALKAYSKRELNPRDAFLAECELERLAALQRANPHFRLAAVDDGWRLYISAARGPASSEPRLAPHFERRDVVVRRPTGAPCARKNAACAAICRSPQNRLDRVTFSSFRRSDVASPLGSHSLLSFRRADTRPRPCKLYPRPYPRSSQGPRRRLRASPPHTWA